MSCELAPSASAFSAMLSAFVGSVINGLTSGWLVAFMTGWIAWFALFRVVWGAVYILYRGVTNSWAPEYDLVPDEGDEDSYPMTAPNSSNSNHIFQGHLGYGGYQSYGQGPRQQRPQVRQRRPGFFSTLWPTASDVRVFRQYASKTAHSSRNAWGPLNQEVNVLGWFGWVWSALYAPVSQIL
jgi:hypothetical protein